jgi:hypothetical protein
MELDSIARPSTQGNFVNHPERASVWKDQHKKEGKEAKEEEKRDEQRNEKEMGQ